MPAVDMTRLRMQIDQLVLNFGQPLDFQRRLANLLNAYADHAYRAGQTIQAQPLLPSYRVTPLLVRQLEHELSKMCREQPKQALALVQALWTDEYLEPRLLAATLLGAISCQEHGAEVIQTLREWSTPEVNLRVFTALAEHGTARLRGEAPELLIGLIEDWLESESAEQQAVGVRALMPLAGDLGFENLPVVFRLLSPVLQAAAPPVQADLVTLLTALARRSPVETAYFMRQVLSLNTSAATPRLVRRVLDEFPPQQQASLKMALQARSAA